MCTSAILQREAALWWQHDATGNTLIHAAASGGHLEIIKFLLAELKLKAEEPSKF